MVHPIYTSRLLVFGDAVLIERAHRSELLADAVVVDRASLEGTLRHNADGLLLVLATHLDPALFVEIDRTCERANVPWVSFHIERGVGWLGPAIVPGQTAHYRDLLARRLCTFDDPTLLAALIAPTPMDGLSLLMSAEVLWMLSMFFIELARWQRTGSCRLMNTELEADPTTWTMVSHLIQPLPDHEIAQWQRAVPHDARVLVSERCGLVLRTVEIAHHPAIPHSLTTVQAHAAHMWWQYPSWHNDSTGVGSTFNDPAGAHIAALAEAVERYAANCLPLAQPRRASYMELIAGSEHAVDPAQLALFSERMYADPGFPFAPFTHETAVYWVRGWSLTYQRPMWVPLSQVYVNWQMGSYDQPTTHDTCYPGIAAGASLEQAIVSGLEELIERDTMMIWWLNRPALAAAVLSPDLAALWAGRPAEHGQRAWLIPLPNEFSIPVMAGVVENMHEGLLNIGFACRPDPIQAGLKAWTEALTLQEGSRDINNPDGRVWAEVRAGTLGDVFKSWRADRCYLDSYRVDFRDVTEQNAQQQIFLDPRAIERVRPWVDLPAQLTLDSLPRLPDRTLATYQARVEERGFEIISVDLTTPDLALSGLHAVRVIVPGLVPDFPAAFPHLSGGRIQQTPVALGWQTHPAAEDALNYFPMPHA